MLISELCATLLEFYTTKILRCVSITQSNNTVCEAIFFPISIFNITLPISYSVMACATGKTWIHAPMPLNGRYDTITPVRLPVL